MNKLSNKVFILTALLLCLPSCGNKSDLFIPKKDQDTSKHKSK